MTNSTEVMDIVRMSVIGALVLVLVSATLGVTPAAIF